MLLAILAKKARFWPSDRNFYEPKCRKRYILVSSILSMPMTIADSKNHTRIL
jgi:hypothetical protein